MDSILRLKRISSYKMSGKAYDEQGLLRKKSIVILVHAMCRWTISLTSSEQLSLE